MNLHWEKAVLFMHEVGCGTVECALKELRMYKIFAHWAPCELVSEIWEQVLTVQTLFEENL